MKGVVIGTYRLPRVAGQPSVTLTATQYGERVVLAGGKYGAHEVYGDRQRVAAHWAGYVSASRGKAVQPASLRYQEAK